MAHRIVDLRDLKMVIFPKQSPLYVYERVIMLIRG